MDYTLSAPTPAAGVTGTASGNFTVTLGTGDPGGNVDITPAASDGTGTFTPTKVTVNNTTRSGTFTYTPAKKGMRKIATTNSSTLTDPAAVPYTTTGVEITASTLLKNASGSDKLFSFLRMGRKMLNGEVYPLPAGIDGLVRGWNRRDRDDLFRALGNGDLEILQTPAALVEDVTTHGVRAIGIDNGAVAVADPAWGAFTDS